MLIEPRRACCRDRRWWTRRAGLRGRRRMARGDVADCALLGAADGAVQDAFVEDAPELGRPPGGLLTGDEGMEW